MDPATGTPNTPYPLIGQVVGGRYHIVSLIGEGGMGIVYKAEQRLGSTLRKVAVKTLHAELSRDPSITARFHREVGTVAQLEHPNTVRVYDFGSTDDGTLYIAMEYLDGKALNRVIESDGALDPRRVGHIVRQIAGSLDEAHRQGIVHRDLKPENVLLIERAGEKDVVKLVDFGIAARTESAEREKEQKLTQQGMVLGTPPYMSPEQFTGKALDARSDVYSLGVMVYEMLTGQLPFQADTAWQWATHHMTSPPRSFDDTPGGGRIPEALRRTVLKALAKEPAERQSSAGQFYTEFVASVGSVTGVALKASPPAPNKTEAMAQPPLAMAPTEGMAAAPAVSAIASPPVALPPAPPREPTSQNRGLIYGLSGVGAALLIAMGVVATMSGRDGGDARPISVAPTATSATPTTEAAPEEPPPAPEQEPTAAAGEPEKSPTTSAPERPKPAGTTKPAASKPTPPAASSSPPPTTPSATPPATSAPATATPSSPAPSAPAPSAPAPSVPAPQPSATQPNPTPQPSATPPKPTPAPVTPAAPAGEDPCTACTKAAAARDFAGASRAYAQCSNSGAQRQCSARVALTAPKAAESAAFNQRCDEAKAIIAAALQMNVPEGRLAKARSACK